MGNLDPRSQDRYPAYSAYSRHVGNAATSEGGCDCNSQLEKPVPFAVAGLRPCRAGHGAYIIFLTPLLTISVVMP